MVETVAEEAQKLKPDFSEFIYLAYVLLFGIVCSLVFMLLVYIRDHYKSKQIGEMTHYPTVPDWLEASTDCELQTTPNFNFYTRYYHKMFGGVRVDVKDGNNIIPDETCVIQIPRKNFVCGRTFTDFEPVFGAAPGSHYTYQMFGNEKLQATYYVESGRSHVAGVCIYVHSPYVSWVHYDERRIFELIDSPPAYWPQKEHAEPPDFSVRWSETQMEPVVHTRSQYGLERIQRIDGERKEFSDAKPSLGYGQYPRREEPRATTKRIRVMFCKERAAPVMFGLRNGKAKHVGWNARAEDFEIVECAKADNMGVASAAKWRFHELSRQSFIPLDTSLRYSYVLEDLDPPRTISMENAVFWVLFLYGWIFIPLTIFLVLYVRAYLESRKIGPITRSPVIPDWYRNEFPNGSQLNAHFKAFTHDYEVKGSRGRWGEWSEKRRWAILKVQKILDDSFGERSQIFRISDRTCFVQIPRKNFKCGEVCYEFEPIFEPSPDTYCTYQMFGNQRIQVTNYVEDGVSHVAGVCIYIHNPYIWGVRFRTEVIRKYLKEGKNFGKI
ncbi:unnamed protein product [Caenorhabditis sp. 36 PRJEB53466]|nr:unnamed protein product [Caenorhabditis sp. 36 PRJEB53466]